MSRGFDDATAQKRPFYGVVFLRHRAFLRGVFWFQNLSIFDILGKMIAKKKGGGELRRFRKFLLWVLMVLLFTVLVVGGVLLYFYYQVQPEESIQKTLTVETLPAEGTEGEARFLKPDGYTLEVPVLGGVLTRAFSADTLGEQQTLEWDQVQAASLTAPEGGQIKKIVVTRADEIIFSDGSEAYAELKYPGSGSYEYEVQVELPAAAEGERMRESGSLTYRFTVAVSLQASAWLSDDRVSQG